MFKQQKLQKQFQELPNLQAGSIITDRGNGRQKSGFSIDTSLGLEFANTDTRLFTSSTAGYSLAELYVDPNSTGAPGFDIINNFAWGGGVSSTSAVGESVSKNQFYQVNLNYRFDNGLNIQANTAQNRGEANLLTPQNGAELPSDLLFSASILRFDGSIDNTEERASNSLYRQNTNVNVEFPEAAIEIPKAQYALSATYPIISIEHGGYNYAVGKGSGRDNQFTLELGAGAQMNVYENSRDIKPQVLAQATYHNSNLGTLTATGIVQYGNSSNRLINDREIYESVIARSENNGQAMVGGQQEELNLLVDRFTMTRDEILADPYNTGHIDQAAPLVVGNNELYESFLTEENISQYGLNLRYDTNDINLGDNGGTLNIFASAGIESPQTNAVVGNNTKDYVAGLDRYGNAAQEVTSSSHNFSAGLKYTFGDNKGNKVDTSNCPFHR